MKVINFGLIVGLLFFQPDSTLVISHLNVTGRQWSTSRKSVSLAATAHPLAACTCPYLPHPAQVHTHCRPCRPAADVVAGRRGHEPDVDTEDAHVADCLGGARFHCTPFRPKHRRRRCSFLPCWVLHCCLFDKDAYMLHCPPPSSLHPTPPAAASNLHADAFQQFAPVGVSHRSVHARELWHQADHPAAACNGSWCALRCDQRSQFNVCQLQ
jgi:hypothetical protein